MHYQLRTAVLLNQALERGIPPTGAAVARLAGMQPGTVNALIAGRAASGESMARLTAALGVTVEQLFTVVKGADDPIGIAS